MPRLAIPFVTGTARLSAETTDGLPGDDYKDRLVKYIPAESVALYTFTDKLVTAYYGINELGSPTRVAPDVWFGILPWALFVLGVVGTPIYLRRQKLRGQPWKAHVVISTVAFILWAYTLNGSLFLVNQWYHVLLASLAAPVFTFVAGWFDPR
jgi:hypothetical protein